MFVHRVLPEQCRLVLVVWLQQRQLPAPWLNEWVAAAASSKHAAFSSQPARVSLQHFTVHDGLLTEMIFGDATLKTSKATLE